MNHKSHQSRIISSLRLFQQSHELAQVASLSNPNPPFEISSDNCMIDTSRMIPIPHIISEENKTEYKSGVTRLEESLIAEFKLVITEFQLAQNDEELKILINDCVSLNEENKDSSSDDISKMTQLCMAVEKRVQEKKIMTISHITSIMRSLGYNRKKGDIVALLDMILLIHIHAHRDQSTRNNIIDDYMYGFIQNACDNKNYKLLRWWRDMGQEHFPWWRPDKEVLKQVVQAGYDRGCFTSVHILLRYKDRDHVNTTSPTVVNKPIHSRL